MASLRKAAQCIGLTGPFAVKADFFGYWYEVPKPISVLTQVRLLQGRHFHLNLIRTAAFNSAYMARIDAAVQVAREAFGAVFLGIGRVERFRVPAGGYEIIMSKDNAWDLWDTYSAPNDGIDAFFAIELIGDWAGESPENGSCDKSGKWSGLVVGVYDNPSALGEVLAHELGHFLGLSHDDAPDNLMYEVAPLGGHFNFAQSAIMRDHCSMKNACQT